MGENYIYMFYLRAAKMLTNQWLRHIHAGDVTCLLSLLSASLFTQLL